MTDIEVTGTAAVTASAADHLVVRLPEVAATGYRWAVDDLDALDVVSDGYEPPADPAPGSTGRRVVVLRPVAPGRARASLVLKRSWETTAAQRVDVDVTVTD